MKLLVVDDDPRILSGTVAILKEAGFTIISASDGAEALALLGANPDVRMIVTDVLMPGMKGPELAARALGQRPDLKIIYVSGDTGDTPRDAFGSWPLLAKPFVAATLLQAVAVQLSA